VRDAVRGDRLDAGVAEHDFVHGHGGGVAIVGGLHVGHEHLVDFGQFRHEVDDGVGGHADAVAADVALADVAAVPVGVLDELAERGGDPAHAVAHEQRNVRHVERFARVAAWEEDLEQVVEHVVNRHAGRNVDAAVLRANVARAAELSGHLLAHVREVPVYPFSKLFHRYSFLMPSKCLAQKCSVFNFLSFVFS